MRLFIDSAEYPFDTSQRLRLGLSAAKLADVESARRGTAVTLRIPAAAETDRLFLAARDPLDTRQFNASHHTARLEHDGATIHSGTAVLSGTESRGGTTWYLLTVTGGAAQWAERAARERFDAIPLEFSATLTPTAIAASWEGAGPVKFLPVLRDTYEPAYSSVGLEPAEKILSTDDYHPFISVGALVKAIFSQAGYTLRSSFMEGPLFRSLYMSGAYAAADTEAVRARMDFSARRSADGEAAADRLGRVYFSPYMTVCSVGNYVDTFSSPDDDGVYSRNGCLRMENGRVVFRPTAAVHAGFEYGLRYVTDYRIATRTRLTGFDSIYTGAGETVRFEIANRFADRRSALTGSFDYLIVVFDHAAGAGYRLTCRKADGTTAEMGRFAARSAKVSTPASECSDPVLYTADGAGGWKEYAGDWALYDGYVSETGQTEISFTLRTQAAELSPASPAAFDSVYMEGAEPGMTLRLLAGCTLRPDFSSTPGYGARLAFADIAHHAVRQTALLESLRQMFNLRFHTDEERREVTVEPADLFYGTREVDWSDRADLSQPVLTHDLALEAHDTLVAGYRDEDGAVRRFNAAHETVFGQWSAKTGRYGSIEGEEELRSPLFSPTINAAGRYANAPSARIMQVCDRDDPSGSAAVSPRIVRWVGMRSLPDGERWGYPRPKAQYPLAAFHLEPGVTGPVGQTLCYEDRDGARGLHRYYDSEIARRRAARAVTLNMRISPEEWESLRRLGSGMPDISCLFRLKIGGETGLYILRSIEDYDPRSPSAKCTFEQWEIRSV